MNVYLRYLILIGALLFVGILGVIFINGAQRCVWNFKQWDAENKSLDVDLYIEDLDQVPQEASSGMTCLLDHGTRDLTTGIYLLREVGMCPLKIGVPMPGEVYHVVRGKYAGCCHTVKQTQRYEVRQNVQVFTPDVLQMEWKRDTYIIVVDSHVETDCVLKISQITEARSLVIVNESNCLLRLVDDRSDQWKSFGKGQHTHVLYPYKDAVIGVDIPILSIVDIADGKI